MTRPERFLDLLGRLPTTQAVVAVAIVLAIEYVNVALIADIAGRPIGEHTLDGAGLFIGGMFAAGGLTFGIKRFSDTGLAQAKAGAPAPITNVSPTNLNINAPNAAPTNEAG